jgi:hypothetical protein
MANNLPQVSRRTFLKGGAALAALADSRFQWAGSNLHLASGDGWVALYRDGLLAFELKSEWFAGQASVWVERAAQQVLFGITSSRHFGLDLAADLTFELWPGSFGVQAAVHHHALDLLFQGQAEDWLGPRGLRAYLRKPFAPLDTGDATISVTPGEVMLCGDGSLHFGRTEANFLRHGIAVAAQRSEMRLPSDSAALPASGDLRSTRLLLHRGTEHWRLNPPRGKWSYDDPSALFERAAIDAAEDDHGEHLQRVVFTSPSRRTPFRVNLDEPVQGTDGRPLQLLMKNASYSLDLQADTQLMEAHLARARRVQMGPLVLRLGVDSDRPALQAGNQGCCIVAQGGLVGNIDNALVVDHNAGSWNVAITSDDDPLSAYSNATLKMVGENPSLSGAINFRILRPDDGLDLCFRLTNVVLRVRDPLPVPEQNPVCSLEIANHSPRELDFSLLIADFPPQAMIIQKLDLSTPTETDDCGADAGTNAYPTRLSAPTRVSMQLLGPQDAPLPLDLDTLLEWAQYPLNIAPRAQAAPAAESLPAIPATATEIVAPAGLSISPDENHAFFASATQRTDGDVSQVWTARLSRRITPADSTSAENAKTHFPVTGDRRPSLRPLVARSLDQPDSFVLSKQELDVIVNKLQQTSATARHCVLSPSSGAWLDFGGVWSPLDGAYKNTSAFHEILAGMLEQRTEFTYEGCLIPTGHRVKIIKSGKMQWCRRGDIDGVPVLVAEFIERFKIVYREPKLISYDWMRRVPGFVANVQSPIASTELLGDGTSYLDTLQAESFTKDCLKTPPVKTDYWAWTQPTGSTQIVPYAFPVRLVDRANVRHVTTMEMLVACFAQSYDQTYNDFMRPAYSHPALPTDGRSYKSPAPSVDLLKQRVAYALPTKMGNTSYPTQKMVLACAEVPNLSDAKAHQTNPWFPQMFSTDLILEQISAFTDPTAGTNASQTFRFASLYKQEPFDDLTTPLSKNRAEVVLSLAPSTAAAARTSVPLIFNGALGGGLALPSTNVIALARKTGNVFSGVAGTEAQIENQLTSIGAAGMKVSDMFAGMGAAATLLGAVQLSDVLQEVSDGIAQASQLPLLAVQQLHTLEAETIGELQTALQPLLTYAQTAQQFYDNLDSQYKQLQDEFHQATIMVAQLTRVIATERRSSDVAALSQQTLVPAIAEMSKRLGARIAMSTIQRIEEAKVWPPVDTNGDPILPTLYQARDYALNQIAVPAQQMADQIDDALEAGEDQFQQDLDKATMTAGQAVGYLTSCVIYQFVQAVMSLTSAISQGDVETAIDAFETLADVTAAIPSLDVSQKGLRKSINDSIAAATDPCSHDALLARAASLSNALTAPIPGPALAVLQAALQDGGQVMGAYAASLKRFNDLVTQVSTFVQTTLAAEEALRQAYLPLQQQVQDSITAARQFLTIPKHINVSYTYSSPLQNAGPFLADLNGDPSQFTLNASVLVNLDGTQPTTTFTIVSEVTNFRLNLLPSFQFVIVGFDKVSFTSINGAAPTVHCPFNADNVQLVGPLDFISDLTAAIGLPPELVVQLTGLSLVVGLNIAIPGIPCGAFDMTGLSVYSAVKLSFLGDPLRVIFGFAMPNQHFIMTYLFLGGGGFVNLEFCPTRDTTGMVVTGALEAGAMIYLDFGVAEGEVHVFAGFYMSIRPNDVLLSGYYRAGGEFDVLGLISASVELIMSLSYENRGGSAWLSGDCEVDIDVHILFFSATAKLHMHHDFCGRSGD